MAKRGTRIVRLLFQMPALVGTDGAIRESLGPHWFWAVRLEGGRRGREGREGGREGGREEGREGGRVRLG